MHDFEMSYFHSKMSLVLLRNAFAQKMAHLYWKTGLDLA